MERANCPMTCSSSPVCPSVNKTETESEGIGTGKAIVCIEDMVETRVRRYQQFENGLDRLCTDLRLTPSAHLDLRRYAHGMRSWMRGDLDWSLETIRYREHAHSQ